MLDIKKNTNNKKMSADITFVLFLCTSDYFFTHPSALLSQCHILCNCTIHFFLFGSTGGKTDILISQRRYGTHNKGLKLGCFFSPICIAITDDSQFKDKIIWSLI